MIINDKNFKKEVIEKSKEISIIVDFWAEWCMPCLTLSPVLEEVIKDFKELAKKIDRVEKENKGGDK